MKEIGAIFVVSISEIRTVQLAAIKRRYTGILWQIMCVVRINVTKSKLYWCHRYLLVQNADSRPDTKYRLETAEWVQNAD